MSRNTIERRVDALEERSVFRGCDVCIAWNGHLVVMIDGETDEELSRSRPDVCPTCGREIRTVHEIRIIGPEAMSDAPGCLPDGY